jgi:transketolase
MVKFALDAANELAKVGIQAQVVNTSTIKPLDKEGVILFAKATGAVVVAGEHSIIGGLGSAILETLGREHIPVECVGIPDCFGQSSQSYSNLLSAYRLTKEEIVRKVKSVLK